MLTLLDLFYSLLIYLSYFFCRIDIYFLCDSNLLFNTAKVLKRYSLVFFNSSLAFIMFEPFFPIFKYIFNSLFSLPTNASTYYFCLLSSHLLCSFYLTVSIIVTSYSFNGFPTFYASAFYFPKPNTLVLATVLRIYST